MKKLTHLTLLAALVAALFPVVGLAQDAIRTLGGTTTVQLSNTFTGNTSRQSVFKAERFT